MASSRNYAMFKYALSFGAGAASGCAFGTFLPFTTTDNTDLKPVVPTPNAGFIHHGQAERISYESAIVRSRDLVRRVKEEFGVPGLCIAVDVDGRTVWTEGFGYADVENGVLCTPNTVMRIASISKSITMAALAKLWEDGKVDLDVPVQEYVPTFPKKSFNGEPVEITTRMLTCHLSGIRHYKEENPQNHDANTTDAEHREFYINDHYKTVESALSIFKDDDLMHKPGTKYLYSSLAWTLVSAVMEKAAEKTFDKIMRNLFKDLHLSHTTLDENEPIMYNRTRYYFRRRKGRLVNAPGVDNSCKWAGGGLQSTVGDLTKFANAMLYSYQQIDSEVMCGYLRKETIEALWTVVPDTKPAFDNVSGYGLGWVVLPKQNSYGGVEGYSFKVAHTGGAVGASSVLLITPSDVSSPNVPKGIAVAIIVNLQDVGLTKLATTVSDFFAQAGSIPNKNQQFLTGS